MNDASELRSLGLRIWGGRWQTALAQGFEVNDRTVRRWGSGAKPVPAEVLPVLRALADALDRKPSPDATEPADWTRRGNRVTHRPTGLVVEFKPADDGAWDGTVIAGMDRLALNPTSAARMLREAGEAFRRLKFG